VTRKSNIKKRSGELSSKGQNKRVLSSKSFQEMKVKRRQEFADKTKAGESRKKVKKAFFFNAVFSTIQITIR
jgi:hypothetical protein